jgi:hypothetical protein
MQIEDESNGDTMEHHMTVLARTGDRALIESIRDFVEPETGSVVYTVTLYGLTVATRYDREQATRVFTFLCAHERT